MPGGLPTIDRMCAALKQAADAMDDAHRTITRIVLDSDTRWTGKAAKAFRDHLSKNLADKLKKAHDSHVQALGHLTQWRGRLGAFQEEAQRLNDERQAASEATNEPAEQYYSDVQKCDDAIEDLERCSTPERSGTS